MTTTTPRHQTTNHRSHDRAARIDEMIADGYRTADIARALGITSATLYGWAKIHGVTLPVPVSVAEGRKDRILELISEGHTRRRIAAELDLNITTLERWCRRKGIALPDARQEPGWPLCEVCGARGVVRSKDGVTPATHGRCSLCRITISGNIVQHAFAYSRWTAYGTYGPTFAAELEHFAWCCVCSAGGQADDRQQAERWARQHNADKHGTTA